MLELNLYNLTLKQSMYALMHDNLHNHLQVNVQNHIVVLTAALHRDQALL